MTLTNRQHDRMVNGFVDLAFYKLDRLGVVRTWNTGAESLKGYTKVEIVGEDFRRFFTDEDRAAGIPEQLLKTALQDESCLFEGWRVKKSGELFWAAVVIDALFDDDGEIEGFVEVTRDLSQERALLTKLEETQIRLKCLINNVVDCALLTLTTDGRIKDWSVSANRLKGYNQAVIAGQHFSRFYTTEDREAGVPKKILEEAIKTGHAVAEGWRVRLDGARFWAHVIVDPMYDIDGKLIGFAKFVRDLTEQRASEAGLLRAKEELLHAQKTHLIGRLSAGVAHDFNNILQSIIGALELALVDGMDSSQFHDIALRSALRGSSLTNQLLSYTRKQMLQPAELKVRPFINELREMMARTVNPRLEIKVRIAGNPSVFVDRGQFSSALLNLAINASDAMPNGGVLKIDIRGERAGRRYVKCTVSDDGLGMDEETLALAVEPFFTTKGVKGSGLGLSMVQGFVEQSGGEFSIHSKLGQGTTVQLKLPSTIPRMADTN